MKLKQLCLFMLILLYCAAQSVGTEEFFIGADTSAATVLEKAGAVYRENGEPNDLIAILKNNGFNTVRLRIFVNPNKEGIVTNDLPYTLNLAKRVKAHNMKLLLNFHYSDTWADPQKQFKPAAWANMSFEELKQTMQSYTASVIEAFKKENVLPDIVQIGNEITPGMLWPDGKVGGELDNELQWRKFTSLLKAGIAGVREATGDPNLKIMLHIDQGGKKSVSQWFFSNINKHQVPYDMIGISYYPSWHGTIEDLKENLHYIATELKKDVMVVETAYPYTTGKWYKPPEEPPFPLTPQGQYDLLHTVTKAVLETPDKRGCGVCYWFPESVPVARRGWMEGTSALFDPNGNVLMGARAFSDAVASSKSERSCEKKNVSKKQSEGLATSVCLAEQPSTFVDEEGVWRYSDSKEEICAFGVNYNVPFAHAYRRIKQLGLDPKEVMEGDIYHMVRMGCDGYRVHLWDIEITDREGNLLENEHLDAFDYLVSRLKERGIWMAITPISMNENGWPDKPTPCPGFAEGYSKPIQSTDEKILAAQENYLRQFMAHINRYTQLAYKDEPFVAAIELVNEPWIEGPEDQIEKYISRLYEAIRSTGCKKPLFYCMSQNPYLRQVYYKIPIQGFGFQWYPSGLGGTQPFKGNLLPHVNHYPLFFKDDPEFKKRAKMAYEFDGARIDDTYLYPAIARTFRQAGFQFAAMFAYDSLPLAEYNSEYPVHFLNLAYTPRKALSFKIASEVFHTTKLNADAGNYPQNTQSGPLRLSYDPDYAIWASDTKFIYTASTSTKPPDIKKLEQIAGYGSSSVVEYQGRGAYFLDKLTSGVWRLEVMPDAIRLHTAYAYPEVKGPVAMIVWRSHPMKINLPDIGKRFHIKGLNEGNSLTGRAENSIITVKPGVYLLYRERAAESKYSAKDRFTNFRLGEFVAPKANDEGKAFILHEPAYTVLKGTPLEIEVQVAAARELKLVALLVAEEKIAMDNPSPYVYKARIPPHLTKGKELVYSFCIEDENLKADSTLTTQNYKVPVITPDQPMVIFDEQQRASPTYSHRLDRKWDSNPGWMSLPDGKKGFAVNTAPKALNWEPKSVDFGFYVADRLPANAQSFSTLAVKGMSLNEKPCPLQVVLELKDGSRYAAPITLRPEITQQRIAIKDLKPIPVIRLASNPSFLDGDTGFVGKENAFDLKKVDGIHFQLGEGLSEEDLLQKNGVVIESVAMEKETG
jgi:arabinogalactan endo-1,4-beta-galactosidase